MKEILKCPVCAKQLKKDESIYICENNHNFDVAKQGYVNLLQSQTSKIHGDNSEMLQARKRVLYSGYYESISEKLNHIISKLNPKQTVLDIGSGIGYYLDMLQKAQPSSSYYGIDISKNGIKEGAKNNKNIVYAVGNNNELPCLSDSVDLIYNVFSPININECLRVLNNGGYFITVSPNTNHLMELKQLIYKEIVDKDYQVNEISEVALTKIDSQNLLQEIHLKNNDLYSLFMMTPHFWKSGLEVKDTIAAIKEFDVTIDVVFNVYQYQT